jgi:hypothetical protein
MLAMDKHTRERCCAPSAYIPLASLRTFLCRAVYQEPSSRLCRLRGTSLWFSASVVVSEGSLAVSELREMQSCYCE